MQTMSKPKPTKKKRQHQWPFTPDADVKAAVERLMEEQEVTPERTATLNHLLRIALREKYPELFTREGSA